MARIARHEFINNPHGPATDHIVAGCNRDALASKAGFVLNSCKCIADECMSWRWVPGDPVKTRFVVESPPGHYHEEAKWIPSEPTHGYCGLAGSPVA